MSKSKKSQSWSFSSRVVVDNCSLHADVRLQRELSSRQNRLLGGGHDGVRGCNGVRRRRRSGRVTDWRDRHDGHVLEEGACHPRPLGDHLAHARVVEAKAVRGRGGDRWSVVPELRVRIRVVEQPSRLRRERSRRLGRREGCLRRRARRGRRRFRRVVDSHDLLGAVGRPGPLCSVRAGIPLGLRTHPTRRGLFSGGRGGVVGGQRPLALPRGGSCTAAARRTALSTTGREPPRFRTAPWRS